MVSLLFLHFKEGMNAKNSPLIMRVFPACCDLNYPGFDLSEPRSDPQAAFLKTLPNIKIKNDRRMVWTIKI